MWCLKATCRLFWLWTVQEPSLGEQSMNITTDSGHKHVINRTGAVLDEQFMNITAGPVSEQLIKYAAASGDEQMNSFFLAVEEKLLLENSAE